VVTANILLTGATGYIGGRLLRALEEGGHAVRCLARRPLEVRRGSSLTEVVAGDCLQEATLGPALSGIETAYYLVHSMAAGASFAERDRQAALNFGRAAARAGVRRIIYLGGLAGDRASLSDHLRSRAETGDALRASGVPVLEFRASIVIGAGSLSFEMIRALVERLPVMVCPRWIDTLAQPIAIDDVVAYLKAALVWRGDGSRVFEVGGPERVSYGGMMREYARQRGLTRLLLPVPVLTPRLSGLWLALVTPAHARIGRALVESLKNPTIVRSTDARDAFPVNPMPPGVALARAIEEGATLARKIDTRTVVVALPPDRVFAPVRRIGGTAGWYFANGLWKARGWIDRACGGVGMTRGRPDPEHCAIGGVIDGWTVAAYVPDRLLRLAADIKLPGRAWLEFEVTPIDGGLHSEIRQTAIFEPRGLLGQAYWYATLPFHVLIFRGMLGRIVERASRVERLEDGSLSGVTNASSNA